MKIQKIQKSKVSNFHPIAIVLLLMALLVLFSHTQADSTENINVEQAKTAIEQWVENQRLISKERRDLILSKEILMNRIELAQREIDTLRGKIGMAEESVAEADKKREDMLQKNNELKEATISLSDTLVTLEHRVQQLLPKLPAPIRQRIEPLIQRLPETDKENELSISERFVNVVGILNEVDKFNRIITTSSEVQTLPDGSSVEVTAMYLGIGQGYYVSADERIAGVGTATETGWFWKPADLSAEEISTAIDILNGKTAAYIQLPIEIE